MTAQGGLNLLANLALSGIPNRRIAWHLQGRESASWWLQANAMIRQAAGPQYLQHWVDTVQVAWPTCLSIEGHEMREVCSGVVACRCLLHTPQQELSSKHPAMHG